MNKFHRCLLIIFLFFLSMTCFTFMGPDALNMIQELRFITSSHHEEFDPLKNYSSLHMQYAIKRRTSDGAVFLVIDKVPYYFKDVYVCPGVLMAYQDVPSPSRFDKVPSYQTIQSYVGYRQFCRMDDFNEDDVTDDGVMLLTDKSQCSSPPKAQVQRSFIDKMCSSSVSVGKKNSKENMMSHHSIDHILHTPLILETNGLDVNNLDIHHQRLRIVHDLVSSQLINSAAVEMSSKLASKLWKVYDKSKTLQALNALGICLFENDDDAEDVVEIGVPTPYKASDLSFLTRTGKLRLHHYKWRFNSNQHRHVNIKADNSGNNNNMRDFNGNLIPDTCHARELLEKVNSAFVSSNNVASMVDQTLSEMMTHFIPNKTERKTQENSIKSSPFIAIHWPFAPSSSPSFSTSSNQQTIDYKDYSNLFGETNKNTVEALDLELGVSLNYIKELKSTFEALFGGDGVSLFRNMLGNGNKSSKTIPVVLIGDNISPKQLESVEKALKLVVPQIQCIDLSQVLSKVAKSVSSFSSSSDQTFMQIDNQNKESVGYEADQHIQQLMKDQVCFEIASTSSIYLGTPYHHFSQLVSQERQHHNLFFKFVVLPSSINQEVPSSIVHSSHPQMFDRKHDHQHHLSLDQAPASSSSSSSSSCVKTEHEQVMENRKYGMNDDGRRDSSVTSPVRKRIMYGNHSSTYPFMQGAKKNYPGYKRKFEKPALENDLMYQQVKEFIDRSGDITDSSQMPNAQNQERCYDLAPRFKFDIKLDDPVRHGGKVCSIAVVTALFGHEDKLHGYHSNIAKLRSEEEKHGLYSCWFAFVDHDAAKHNVDSNLVENACLSPHHTIKYGIWDLVLMDTRPGAMPFYKKSDLKKNSRIPKMLIHRAFDYASYLLYHDSKVNWLSLQSLYHFVNLNMNSNLTAWVSPRHPNRPSLYHEARCTSIVGLVQGGEVYEQMKLYSDEGMPTFGDEAPAGLIEGEWHLRNLKSKASSRQGCDWFREYSKWNHARDQLSFNYVLYNISLSEWTKEEDTSGGAFKPFSQTSITSSHIHGRYERSVIGYDAGSLPKKKNYLQQATSSSGIASNKPRPFFFSYKNESLRSPFKRRERTSVAAMKRLPSSVCDEPHRENKVAEQIKQLWVGVKKARKKQEKIEKQNLSRR